MVAARIDIPMDLIRDFCRRWKVTEFSLFGSVLREDFRTDSDVDVLVTFAPESTWSYWDYPAMIDELELLFGRKVDLVEKDAVTNPFRRFEILTHRQVLYAA